MRKFILGSIENGLQLWVRSSNGRCQGQATTLADGSSSGAYLVPSAEIMPLETRELDVIQFVGGGLAPMANIPTGNTGFDPFVIQLNEQDDVLRALLGGTTIETTQNANWRMSTGVVDASDVITVGMQLSYQMSDNAGSSKKFHHIVIPKALVIPRTFWDGDKLVTQLQVAAQRTTVAPTGETMTTVCNVNEVDHYEIETDNPLFWGAYRSDGAATTFTSTYLPQSSVVTINDTPNYLTNDGVHEALSSANIATAVMTLAGAGTTGDLFVLAHEVNPTWTTP